MNLQFYAQYDCKKGLYKCEVIFRTFNSQRKFITIGQSKREKNPVKKP